MSDSIKTKIKDKLVDIGLEKLVETAATSVGEPISTFGLLNNIKNEVVEIKDKFIEMKEEVDVKVMMLGGRRCGKSSILASMDCMLRDQSGLSCVANITNVPSQTQGITLSSKKNELISFMSKNTGSRYIVDDKPTSSISRYKFGVESKTEKGGKMVIEFIDVPGEFYKKDHENYDTIKEEMETVDVFIVAIDTPYLMEKDKGKNKEVNYIDSITELLNGITNCNYEEDDCKKIKKVIFAPVKCEKWKDGVEANELYNKFEEAYKTLLDNLKKDDNCSILYIPVFTAGGLEFDIFAKPKMVTVMQGTEKKDMRCIDFGKYFYMEDGSVKTKEEVEDNNNSTQDERDVSWFKHTGEYKPENCDQIMYHVFRFLLAKYKSNYSGFLGQLKSILGKIFFGSLSLNAAEDILKGLSNEGIILDKGNGIVNIKKLEEEEV